MFVEEEAVFLPEPVLEDVFLFPGFDLEKSGFHGLKRLASVGSPTQGFILRRPVVDRKRFRQPVTPEGAAKNADDSRVIFAISGRLIWSRTISRLTTPWARPWAAAKAIHL